MSTIVTAPMYHSAPNAQALFPVALGIDLTILPRFAPEEILSAVSERRITHAQVVPGGTETGIVVTCDTAQWLAHPGTVGAPLAAHVDVDPDARLTEEDVRDHVRARLAGYQVPRLIAFDNALPRVGSGQHFKRRIRERYWRESGRAI